MSEFASSEYTAGQLNAIVKLLRKQAGEDAPERFLRGELIVSEPAYYVESTQTLTVNYDISLADALVLGKYDSVNGNITQANFPPSGKGTQTIEAALFHFDKTMTSKRVIAEMNKAGYRPATIEELLALGQVNPDLQRKYPIVALGSSCVVDGGRNVSYLSWGSNERKCNLSRFDFDLNDRCRFLAVRK